ncbi:MAG: hypothetical protein ACAF41_10910 [Leptolyngbya sp. BL-A-14]
MNIDNSSDFRQVPRQIRERVKRYGIWAGILQALFIVLAIASVVTSLVAATFTDELKNGVWLKALTFTAALLTALLNSFNVQGKASDVWRAFRHLEQAILEYSEGKTPDIDKLLSAHKEAENMVGFVSFKDSGNK